MNDKEKLLMLEREVPFLAEDHVKNYFKTIQEKQKRIRGCTKSQSERN